MKRWSDEAFGVQRATQYICTYIYTTSATYPYAIVSSTNCSPYLIMENIKLLTLTVLYSVSCCAHSHEESSRELINNKILEIVKNFVILPLLLLWYKQFPGHGISQKTIKIMPLLAKIINKRCIFIVCVCLCANEVNGK